MRGTAKVSKAKLFVVGDHLVLFGTSEEDSRGRFPKGHRIVTSKVESIDGCVVKTEYTDYTVVGPAATSLLLCVISPNEAERLFISKR